MAAVVTLNSTGTEVDGVQPITLSPVPPISNCLGKMVYLVLAGRSANDTFAAPTGATYYLLGTANVETTMLQVYYKNGEASEPTPSVVVSGSGFAGSSAQIFVLDIAGGTFPTVAAAGDARLATNSTRFGSPSGLNYSALTVVGGGYLLQFGTRQLNAGSCTAIATTAGFTQVSFTAGGGFLAVASQLQNAATVLGSDAAANNCAITTNTETVANSNHGLTVEMNVIQVAPINYVPQGNRIYVLP